MPTPARAEIRGWSLFEIAPSARLYILMDIQNCTRVRSPGVSEDFIFIRGRNIACISVNLCMWETHQEVRSEFIRPELLDILNRKESKNVEKE